MERQSGYVLADKGFGTDSIVDHIRDMGAETVGHVTMDNHRPEMDPLSP